MHEHARSALMKTERLRRLSIDLSSQHSETGRQTDRQAAAVVFPYDAAHLLDFHNWKSNAVCAIAYAAVPRFSSILFKKINELL